MRKAKKEINYSRIFLKYIGLTVAWTVGVYWAIYLFYTVCTWLYHYGGEISWWYMLLFVVFVICCLVNIIDMSDEIDYLKGNKEEE